MIEATASPAGNIEGIRGIRNIADRAAHGHQRIRRYEMSVALRSYLQAKYLGPGTVPDTAAPVHFARPHPRHVARNARTATLWRAGAKVRSLGATLVLCAVLAVARPAHADQLVLADAGVLIGDDYSSKYSFDVPSAGTLTLNLEDFAWPSPLESLSLEITNATQTLLTMASPGQENLSLTGAGTYYAYVTGTAQGSLDIGAYGLLGTFQPQVAPVPLPPGLLLLLGGMAAGAWCIRRRPTQSPEEDMSMVVAGVSGRVSLPAPI